MTHVDGHPLFKALHTGKNEYGEIRLQNLVQSSSLDHVMQPIAEMQQTRDAFGQGPIKLLNVDNCCQIRAKLEKMIPSLLQGLAEKTVLPLPPDDQIRLLHNGTQESTATLNAFLSNVWNYVQSTDNASKVPLSVDCEWDVEGDVTHKNVRKVGKVSLIQLAIHKNEPMVMQGLSLRFLAIYI